VNAKSHNSGSENLLNALSAFLAEEDSTPSTAEITKNLQRQGVDFSKVLKDISKNVQRAENRLRLRSIATEVKNTSVQSVEMIAGSIQELRERVAAYISSLGGDLAVNAFYRKLESADEEDLRSLLEDFEDLKRQAENDISHFDKSD